VRRGDVMKHLYIYLLLMVVCGISWLEVYNGVKNFGKHSEAVSRGFLELKLKFKEFEGIVAVFDSSLTAHFPESVDVQFESLQVSFADEEGDYYGTYIVNFHIDDPSSFQLRVSGGYGTALRKRVKEKDSLHLILSGMVGIELRTGRLPVFITYPVSSEVEM